MASKIGYLGSPSNIEGLLVQNISLNDQVMDQVNDSQELLMLNTFSHESNESALKKCMKERVADIASWRWVLDDLAKRLEDAASGLKYEQKALRVVVARVDEEIQEFSCARTKPGALTPMSDSVEEAILQENRYLIAQKRRFETMITELDEEAAKLHRIKRRLEDDVIGKDKAITIEERCINFDPESLRNSFFLKKKKHRGTPVDKWEQRCENLKKTGLHALSNAIVVRQKIRGARNQLTIAAQSHASRVDTVLRRRLHINRNRFEELKWQKDEIVRDLSCLDEELLATEKTIVSNIDQIQVLQARKTARGLKPRRELTNDHIDVNLKTELGRLRKFNKNLRANIDRIHILKVQLQSASNHTECAMTDLSQVLSLDVSRIEARSGTTVNSVGKPSGGVTTTTQTPSYKDSSTLTQDQSLRRASEGNQSSLYTIMEENQDDFDLKEEYYDGGDDYPFDF